MGLHGMLAPARSGPENGDEGKSSQEVERLVVYLLGPRRPDDWIHTGSWAMTIGLSYRSRTRKEQDWKIGDKAVLRAGMWMDLWD